VEVSADRRLREKVVALSILMDDHGLVEVSLPEVDNDDAAEDHALESSDVDAITAHLAGVARG
jgi:hypothetical protein